MILDSRKPVTAVRLTHRLDYAKYKSGVDITEIFSTLRVSPTFHFPSSSLHCVRSPSYPKFTMFASSFVVLSVLGYALAFPQHYPRQDFSDQDLFDSCPGGPGSSKFERADRCTLVSAVNHTQ